jgi:hypothetical protein
MVVPVSGHASIVVRLIVTADSVTELDDVAGKVLVAGSHGGIVAAHYAATARVRALILNDAGIGKDQAGIAGLRWAEPLGLAVAAVAHRSARIGDGLDMLVHGVISNANRHAALLGVTPDMPCRDAAVRLSAASIPQGPVPDYGEGRYELAPGVWGLDSIGLVLQQDAGRLLLIGSHAALHGGRRESALSVDAAFAAFNDAGGVSSRLPVLDERDIPAATVGCMSARIGDARSMWETGVLTQVNGAAARFDVIAGQPVRAAIDRIIAAQKKG